RGGARAAAPPRAPSERPSGPWRRPAEIRPREPDGTRWRGPTASPSSRPMRWRRSRARTSGPPLAGRGAPAAAIAPATLCRIVRRRPPAVERASPDIFVDGEPAMDRREGALVAIGALAQATGDPDRYGRIRVVHVQAVAVDEVRRVAHLAP